MWCMLRFLSFPRCQAGGKKEMKMTSSEIEDRERHPKWRRREESGFSPLLSLLLLVLEGFLLSSASLFNHLLMMWCEPHTPSSSSLWHVNHRRRWRKMDEWLKRRDWKEMRKFEGRMCHSRTEVRYSMVKTLSLLHSPPPPTRKGLNNLWVLGYSIYPFSPSFPTRMVFEPYH